MTNTNKLASNQGTTGDSLLIYMFASCQSNQRIRQTPEENSHFPHTPFSLTWYKLASFQTLLKRQNRWWDKKLWSELSACFICFWRFWGVFWTVLEHRPDRFHPVSAENTKILWRTVPVLLHVIVLRQHRSHRLHKPRPFSQNSFMRHGVCLHFVHIQ